MARDRAGNPVPARRHRRARRGGRSRGQWQRRRAATDRRPIALHRQPERTWPVTHLLRSLAPIPTEAWDLLDEEAKQRLTGALAARKLVDFAGPFGWSYSASNLGRCTRLSSS